jgi:hypothetical protein
LQDKNLKEKIMTENNNKQPSKFDGDLIAPILFGIIAVIIMAIGAHFMGGQ